MNTKTIFAVLKNPKDYRYRAQIMWGGSVMHNGLTGCGVADDWATHQLSTRRRTPRTARDAAR